MKLLLATALLCATASAQNCPVKIDKFAGDKLPVSPYLHLAYTNAADKTIASLVFRVDGENPLGETHALLPTPEYDILENQKKHPFNPGVTSKMNFQNDQTIPTGMYRIYLYGVKFADGSVWKDDGSKACALVSTL